MTDEYIHTFCERCGDYIAATGGSRNVRGLTLCYECEASFNEWWKGGALDGDADA